VIKLAKSGGVVVRPPEQRKAAREQRVREYFYGPRHSLMPFSNTVRAEELQIYRIGGWGAGAGPGAATSAALPCPALAGLPVAPSRDPSLGPSRSLPTPTP
jgi:polyribonucleotide 5'-hydroxyl-kinase